MDALQAADRRGAMTLSGYPLNPSYGAGAFRRRVRLRQQPGRIAAVLDDNNHAMAVTLFHDGTVLTRLDSEMVRIPFDVCPEARQALSGLAGLRLDTAPAAVFAGGLARRHCTHLFDMVALCLRLHADGKTDRVFDVLVHDPVDGLRAAEAQVDGRTVHAWQLAGEEIAAPSALAGRSLTGGFVGWASATMAGEVLDAALMLLKGVMVARARPYVIDGVPGATIDPSGARSGSCFTFSEPHLASARVMGGHVRDFSAGVVDSPWPG